MSERVCTRVAKSRVDHHSYYDAVGVKVHFLNAHDGAELGVVDFGFNPIPRVGESLRFHDVAELDNIPATFVAQEIVWQMGETSTDIPVYMYVSVPDTDGSD